MWRAWCWAVVFPREPRFYIFITEKSSLEPGAKEILDQLFRTFNLWSTGFSIQERLIFPLVIVRAETCSVSSRNLTREHLIEAEQLGKGQFYDARLFLETVWKTGKPWWTLIDECLGRRWNKQLYKNFNLLIICVFRLSSCVSEWLSQIRVSSILSACQTSRSMLSNDQSEQWYDGVWSKKGAYWTLCRFPWSKFNCGSSERIQSVYLNAVEIEVYHQWVHLDFDGILLALLGFCHLSRPFHNLLLKSTLSQCQLQIFQIPRSTSWTASYA